MGSHFLNEPQSAIQFAYCQMKDFKWGYAGTGGAIAYSEQVLALLRSSEKQGYFTNINHGSGLVYIAFFKLFEYAPTGLD